jgi:hypothetical protein
MKFFHRAGWVINKMEAGLQYVALDRPVFPEPWEPEFNSSWLWAQPLLFYNDHGSARTAELLRSMERDRVLCAGQERHGEL